MSSATLVAKHAMERTTCVNESQTKYPRTDEPEREVALRTFKATEVNLTDPYQFMIHNTRYARVRDDLGGRRETWGETCVRTIEALCKGTAVDAGTKARLLLAMVNQEVMPSMRVAMTAGAALERENMCAYNCAYLAVDDLTAFREILYILSCGAGVGFSCERRYVDKLPAVAPTITGVETKVAVADSAVGWALALDKYLTTMWLGGVELTPDYSRIRPAGAPLKTMGGRASGPEPLKRLFAFVSDTLRGAAGRKMRPIEVHDLVCMIAGCIVSGGVRRSALISLSDLDDDEMRLAKSGNWWEHSPHRSNANNSAVYDGRPEEEVFRREWSELVKSRSGERGIFNRRAAQEQAARSAQRPRDVEYGTNPCGEILLRSRQTCNLSEVIARSTDTEATLLDKVELATIFGTLQARFTKYNESVLSPEWRKNNEEECLLGVSITGIMDCELLSDPKRVGDGGLLERLRERAVEVNRAWAARVGVNPSRGITTVKPSGTVSQLTGCSSGIHPRWADYYIRRVRLDKTDPVVKFMEAEMPGLAIDTDAYNESHAVFSYPMRAPHGSVISTTKDAERAKQTHRTMSALQQLELWGVYSAHYCDHNPSISVYVRDTPEDWTAVGDWVWNNFERVRGIAFFPENLGTYVQAPFEAITEEHYNELVGKLPDFAAVDWGKLVEYERGKDRGALESSHREGISCTAGACEL